MMDGITSTRDLPCYVMDSGFFFKNHNGALRNYFLDVGNRYIYGILIKVIVLKGVSWLVADLQSYGYSNECLSNKDILSLSLMKCVPD